LAGRGGNGSDITVTIDNDYNGVAGGNSPLISAIVTGQSIGTSFAVVIGDGTNDGISKFGTIMQSTPGGNASGPGTFGSLGVATFPVGSPTMYHLNTLFGEYQDHPTLGIKIFRGYGEGGAGGYHINLGGSVTPVGATAGMTGICVVQW
jgi:hypothetical protein